MIGFDGNALVRVNQANAIQVYATGFSDVQGLAWLPDGSLVAATDLGLVSIAPNLARIFFSTMGPS